MSFIFTAAASARYHENKLHTVYLARATYVLLKVVDSTAPPCQPRRQSSPRWRGEGREGRPGLAVDTRIQFGNFPRRRVARGDFGQQLALITLGERGESSPLGGEFAPLSPTTRSVPYFLLICISFGGKISPPAAGGNITLHEAHLSRQVRSHCPTSLFLAAILCTVATAISTFEKSAVCFSGLCAPLCT